MDDNTALVLILGVVTVGYVGVKLVRAWAATRNFRTSVADTTIARRDGYFAGRRWALDQLRKMPPDMPAPVASKRLRTLIEQHEQHLREQEDACV